MAILQSSELSGLSDRQLKKRIRDSARTLERIQNEDARKVVQEGRQDATLAEMDDALSTMNAGRKILEGRKVQAIINNLPVQRGMREEAQAQQARRKGLEPAQRALNQIASLEITGPTNASRLSPEEGADLFEMQMRKEPLSPAERLRWEALVEKAAGNPGAFAASRSRAAVAEKQVALVEEERLAALPEKTYKGRGLVVLPPFVLDWLTASKNESWTVADVGALFVLLSAIENRRSPFPNTHFDDDVLVVPGGLDGLVLPPGSNPSDDFDSTGHVRFRVALPKLVANKWLLVERDGGTLRIRPGARSRKLHQEGGDTTNGNSVQK